jgi:hypothetical protein
MQEARGAGMLCLNLLCLLASAASERFGIRNAADLQQLAKSSPRPIEVVGTPRQVLCRTLNFRFCLRPQAPGGDCSIVTADKVVGSSKAISGKSNTTVLY